MDDQSPGMKKPRQITKIITRNTGFKHRIAGGEQQFYQPPQDRQFCDCQPSGLNRCQTMQQSAHQDFEGFTA